ncbi:hypothetical protein [Chryseobacterium populi]|uniref:Uncharacterized protein n=1 Tax=Chryseobacterium populi TaxID=1144316 RepID=J2KAW7_9FLAO|nr:hypothetical protein [Chryseobacterium populi]EJL70328.1 hypothetical protein PMI13_02870 [Chryseobacterium populi]
MRNADLNRVVFYSKEDMAGGHQLSKGENKLKSDIQENYSDINDVLELYNIKKYLDSGIYLNKWSQEEISDFKEKANSYNRIIGKFIASINDENVISFHEKIIHSYVVSFWELIDSHNGFHRISKINFESILSNEPYLINIFLTHKNLVNFYDFEIKNFLLTYSKTAEILLSFYEKENSFHHKKSFLPKSLSIEDKELIIDNYLDSNDTNLNYVQLIQNVRTKNDFKINDKTRLKAKRLNKSETEKFLLGNRGIKYGVTVGFKEGADKIKEGSIDANHTVNYVYSVDFIKENTDPYSLFKNFKYLFEYVDEQNRIDLISKRSQIGAIERLMGVQSQNDYKVGISFFLSELTSQAQIHGYIRMLNLLDISLENVFQSIFTNVFQDKYNFAENATFSVSSAVSNFEKVRFLAPEFESLLKQYKLYVEDGIIDFELLQISSSPSALKDIPSININKYIYFNDNCNEVLAISNLFFSDQMSLSFVEPFLEKNYTTFFDLLANEKVKLDSYHEHQKPQLDYLIEKGLIIVDNDGFLQITNIPRVFIIKDLRENEVGSYYHYPSDFQTEVLKMISEDMIYFGSSLFSKPEQAYLNYFLNKSDFTNGMDLRNSYLHGTQATPDNTEKHDHAYIIYLKLLVLVLLKIDDDLAISKLNN